MVARKAPGGRSRPLQTFTLDERTIERIEALSASQGLARGRVVDAAVAAYAARPIPLCSVPGCAGPVTSGGMCAFHACDD